jgi:hypothetical protein
MREATDEVRSYVKTQEIDHFWEDFGNETRSADDGRQYHSQFFPLLLLPVRLLGGFFSQDRCPKTREGRTGRDDDDDGVWQVEYVIECRRRRKSPEVFPTPTQSPPSFIYPINRSPSAKGDEKRKKYLIRMAWTVAFPGRAGGAKTSGRARCRQEPQKTPARNPSRATHGTWRCVRESSPAPPKRRTRDGWTG